MGDPERYRGWLTGRRLFVTGAASGIGLAIADLAVTAGANVVITDLDQERVEAASARTGASGIPADLTDLDSLPNVVSAAAVMMGGIDGIVCAAGVSLRERLDALPMEWWHRSLDVNLSAPFVIAKSALPWLLERKGSTIVNIASGMGVLPDRPRNTAYAASKGGVIALSKALAAELAPDVRVNALCPGLTRTPMTEDLIAESEAAGMSLTRHHALQRVAEPEEIAAAAIMLTSDETSYMTGTTAVVDGGRIFH